MLPERGAPATVDLPEVQPSRATEGAAFGALFEEHFSFVWRLVRRLGVPEAATDDATQQVFLVLADRLEQIEPGKAKAFLTGTAIRVASNHRRANRRRIEIADPGPIEAAAHPAEDPEVLLERRRERLLLDRALDALPDDLRTVLVLSELEELTNPELSALLQVPLGTVASRLRRARAAFRSVAEQLRIECEGDHG